MVGKGKEVTIEEIALSNMFSIEAIVNLLAEKKLLTKQEILEEILRLKSEYMSKKH